MKSLIPFVVCAVVVFGQGQSVTKFKYEGRSFELIPGPLDLNGFPTGSARVCSARSTAGRQTCFAPPNEEAFGLSPTARVVALDARRTAIFFTATSFAGGSDGLKLLALLESDAKGTLRNLFPPELSVSFRGEQEWWAQTKLYGFPLLVTADFIWGAGESHMSAHRYNVSLYGFDEKKSTYLLQDHFETQKKYDAEGLVGGKPLVLASEKSVIVAHIQRLSR